ncbi:hypothetical protein HYW87_04340 [Candidatus Roizmanbacteria bacterium]|nr:hypothetical protein [Candidatus Roizmanbacteria bacterium]
MKKQFFAKPTFVTLLITLLVIAAGLFIYTNFHLPKTYAQSNPEVRSMCEVQTGKIRRATQCVTNTSTGQSLCFILRTPTLDIYITGATDRLDTKIGNNVNSKASVNGLWIKKGAPWYFIVGNLAFVPNLTPTPTPTDTPPDPNSTPPQ